MHMNATQPMLKVADGKPPSLSLDLGRPQRAIYDLVQASAFAGETLDVGCASGEHALMLAAHGLRATGVDDAPAALLRAQKKARERGLAVDFHTLDLLRLPALGRTFDGAIDVGTLHRFAPGERAAYARSLRGVLRAGARLHVLVFGEHEVGHGGPARITQAELRGAFADGFSVDGIVASRFESLIFPGGAHAWLATLTRL